MEGINARSSWFAVTLVITGMIVGYVVQLHRIGISTASAAYSCPFKQECAGGNCNAQDCANGTCGPRCAGCKGGAQS